MSNVSEIFGSKVFNLPTMKARLPKGTYESLLMTINEGTPLDQKVADVVANAMKDWAIENGCTHYTHWFQPMTGVTAEKHDAFIQPNGEGMVINEFSGKNLVMGEPDASSFPSGGLRSTFEARGYTTWDPTSYAFIKDDSLCIPTSFISYTGEVLDKKTPLLRSIDAVSKEAKRVLACFGKNPSRVISYLGPEQEYFLVDKELWKKRKDLVLTGRTLFGASPAKGQEMDHHYFGQLKERVSAFMKEVDEELWKLGVYSKTKHNEAAPAQHEVAPIFSTTNTATDHNQLTMEVLKKVAGHHGLVCLLHEKPYEGINGSGKHNNWSIGTSDGENLLKPGKDPASNTQFLLFLAAVIKAVDDYAEILRVGVATAGNDHRLGGHEAPPAIVSIYLGEQLENIVNSLADGEKSDSGNTTYLETGVDTLPVLKKDTTDRNRTSPFAFTGNRFEFRMPGSSQSSSGVNIIINTIVAESLSLFADILEKADDVNSAAMEIVVDTFKKHRRILFNGNGYSEEWIEEAAKRGLPHLRTSVEALPHFASEKSIALFEKHNVFTPLETQTRTEIMIEDYSKTVHIEMLASLEMLKQEILPACISYTSFIVDDIAKKESIGIKVPNQKAKAQKLSQLTEELIEKTDILDDISVNIPSGDNVLETAIYYNDKVIPAMNAARAVADTLETMVSKDYWPFPTYTDLLYNV